MTLRKGLRSVTGYRPGGGKGNKRAGNRSIGEPVNGKKYSARPEGQESLNRASWEQTGSPFPGEGRTLGIKRKNSY